MAFSETKLFWIVLCFRFCCAVLLCQTQFVPDEYWQCLEPAHRLAFGYGYLTWEWIHALRSYIYPLFYAIPFKILDVLRLDSYYLVVSGPKMIEALITAIGDVYLYKFAKRLAGEEVGFWTLLCHCSMWFSAYCTGRTLSNGIETVLLVLVLYMYPWPVGSLYSARAKIFYSWRYISLATIAVFIRPTSLVFWAPLAVWHWWRVKRKIKFIFRTFLPIVLPITLVCTYIDRICYGRWELTLWNFARFNVFQGGSAFFGSHPFHWYFTQGLPVVCFTHLLPAIAGIYWSETRNVMLLALAGVYILVHSVLAHKEFRFLLPLLPICAFYAGMFFAEQCQQYARMTKSKLQQSDIRSLKVYWNLRVPPRLKIVALPLLAACNLALLLYTGLLHQRAPLDVMHYLHRNVIARSSQHLHSEIVFLMPCHSTPFYSHLHVNVSMRFLTCDPNLNNSATHKDEADAFHADPLDWMNYNLGKNGNRMPTHLVMYEWLSERYFKWFQIRGYHKEQRFYHSFFYEKPRQSKYVDVYVLRN